jgi:hypothetical protein
MLLSTSKCASPHLYPRFAIQTYYAMEHDNQPIPTALLSKEGPKEFNTPNEHGEQVFTSYQQVLAVAISWSTTMQ